MKHVSQLITPQSLESVVRTAPQSLASQESASSKASSDAHEEEMLKRLWKRMTEIYGHRWLSSYGLTPNDSWRRGLAGITGQQIANGLSRMLEQGSDWPPTLPQFRALCVKDPDAPLAPYHRPAPKLLGAPRNPEKARAALAECRRILGQSTT